MHSIDYLSLSDSKQRVRYCLSCPIVFDLLNALICMHRSDYMSLSDSLQRVRRCISKMNELDLGKEWLMVCSYLLSIMFNFHWLCYIHCCVTYTDVYA